MATQPFKVREGDTVSSIAKQFGVSPADVTGFRSNDPNTIFAGETVNVNIPDVLVGDAPTTSPAPTDLQQTPLPAGEQAPTSLGEVPPAPQTEAIATTDTQVAEEPEPTFDEETGDELFTLPSGLTGTEDELLQAVEEEEAQAEGFFNQFGLSTKEMEQGFLDNPFGTLSELTQQVMNSFGFADLRSTVAEVADKIESLENERDAKIRAVEDDPFLSAGSTAERIARINDEYDSKINARVNKLTLLQNQEKIARDNTKFAIRTALDLFGKGMKFEEQQLDNFIDAEGRVVEARKTSEGQAAESQNPLNLTRSQINKGMAAAGDLTVDDFLSRPISEQQDFVFGGGSGLQGGRVEPQTLVAVKNNMKTLAEEQDYSREELMTLVEDLGFPPADELELLIYLDEVAPIKTGFFAGLKGVGEDLARGTFETVESIRGNR